MLVGCYNPIMNGNSATELQDFLKSEVLQKNLPLQAVAYDLDEYTSFLKTCLKFSIKAQQLVSPLQLGVTNLRFKLLLKLQNHKGKHPRLAPLIDRCSPYRVSENKMGAEVKRFWDFKP